MALHLGIDRAILSMRFGKMGQPSRYGPYNNCYDLVYDAVSIMEDSWNPYYWAEDYRKERWDDRWGVRVHHCLRAGLDLAGEMSAGVVSFEV